jgi:hypothetical protein
MIVLKSIGVAPLFFYVTIPRVCEDLDFVEVLAALEAKVQTKAAIAQYLGGLRMLLRPSPAAQSSPVAGHDARACWFINALLWLALRS